MNININNTNNKENLKITILSFLKQPISAYLLMGFVAIFLTITANLTFFHKLINTYPINHNLGFVLSVGIVLLGLHLFLFMLIGYKYTIKAILIFFIIVASVTSYFTDVYSTVYDTNMLQNAIQTDTAEAGDLINIKLFSRIFLLGILPSLLIIKVKIQFPTFRKSILTRVVAIAGSLALVGFPILLFSSHYASFFREHKPLRYYTNPITPIYSAGNLLAIEYNKLKAPTHTIMHAADAKQISLPNKRKPKLVVMVVGEAVRAADSSFNNYNRETFPQIKKIITTGDKLTYFTNMQSCGTSTAFSVPCMFSYLNEKDYNVDEAGYHENVVDTLYNLGVNIRWRDNNSSSKGVMDRLPNELFSDYKSGNNPNCANHKSNADAECRDIAMLENLDNELLANKDNFIILHQMGNHGPAYFKRYDEKFAKFSSVCKSNELSTCNKQAIINAYDNAMLSTDDFLAKTIYWLKTKENDYDVSMLYASDHGESLGENGIYLHGIPKTFAPKEQYEIPAIIWLGKDNNYQTVNKNKKLSHDDITPTLLKLFNVQAQIIKGGFIK